MGDPLVEFAVNLLGNVLGEFVAHLVEAFGRSRLAGRNSGKTGRRADTGAALDVDVDYAARALAGLAEDFDLLRDSELAGISPQDWQAAARQLRDWLVAATPFDESLAFEADLRPEALGAIIRSRGAGSGPTVVLSEGGQLAFEQLLAVTCRRILEALTRLPGFDRAIQIETFRRVDDTRRAVGELASRQERHAMLTDGSMTAFEHRYLSYVAQSLGRFELFGVVRGRVPRTQSFSDSYVSLAVARTGGFDQDDRAEGELTGAGIDVASAFAECRRVILRGSAGTGKTTLLQWLAATGAANRLAGDEGPWGEVVPFLIHLRDFANRELPQIEQLPAAVARAIEGERPPGWAISRFRDGTALLLVDGVDEVAAEHREQVRDWLGGLVLAYPQARYVVTVRPFAVPEDWLAAADFDGFDLLPLSAKGIRDLLSCWHNAARHEHRLDQAMLEWLDTCEGNLAELVSTRPELRRLAASPLLCGLYQDRNMDLPKDRKSLFDAALELLLVRWDEQRGIKIEAGTALSQEEQLVLLQRFAYSLVKNQDLVVSTEQAVTWIAHAMRGLRPHHSDPQLVLRHTLERTGLLQEPRTDQIQFVHRTFRDYLAAKEVVDAGDLGFLVEQAHLDQWHDVVIMSVAHARPRERETVLRALLRGNSEVRRDPHAADRLHLLAAACLEQAHVMDTDEVRRMVQAAAARLIPPASFDDAEFLARAGGFVLDLLPGPEGLTDHQAACVVRTVAHIGGAASRERIRQFAAVNQSMVIDELLRAWRDSDDPEDYARTVLSEVEFGDREVRVRGWHRLRYLPSLTKLGNLVCPGDLTPLDPIAAIPALRRLELVQNGVLRSLAPLAGAPALESLSLNGCTLLRDLAPLAGCRTLRVLHLSGCSLIRDFAPLVASTIEELSVHLMSADLGSLAGAGLTGLVIRDRRLAEGLHVLPQDLPLRRLTIDNLPEDRNLRGIERWAGLEYVGFCGAPDDEEIRALAALPRLRRVTVSRSPGADALGSLRDRLPGVEISLAAT